MKEHLFTFTSVPRLSRQYVISTLPTAPGGAIPSARRLLAAASLACEFDGYSHWFGVVARRSSARRKRFQSAASRRARPRRQISRSQTVTSIPIGIHGINERMKNRVTGACTMYVHPSKLKTRSLDWWCRPLPSCHQGHEQRHHQIRLTSAPRWTGTPEPPVSPPATETRRLGLRARQPAAA